jgi:hypothetical protein
MAEWQNGRLKMENGRWQMGKAQGSGPAGFFTPILIKSSHFRSLCGVLVRHFAIRNNGIKESRQAIDLDVMIETKPAEAQ